jgi:hypothetical protein
MIGWLFTFLIVYLLYKLIFDFIIPVSRASSQVRSKLNQMHQHQQQEQQTASTQKGKRASVRPAAEDYIDFEEVK